MAAAIINGIQSQGVGATIKHFAVNNQESNRSTVNTIVSERALREIYLRNFEIAIKASQPWAVMSSYNLLNGTYTSESTDLLTTILREDWNFRGYVMSDWFGGKDAIGQMKAGNNLLMPGTSVQTKAIVDAVKSGQLDETVLDKNIAGILQVMLQTPTFKQQAFPNKTDLVAHAAISKQAAEESMVLLKNSNNTLPLATSKSIALFGNNAYDLVAGGTGSGDVSKAYAISLDEGLTGTGYSLDKEITQTYKGYLGDYAAKHPKKSFVQEFMNPTPPAPEYVFERSIIQQKAATAGAAIIYIGRNAGEGTDRKVENDYQLTNIEKQGITAIAEAFHSRQKPVIVVINSGGVIDVTQFRDQVDAILLAWQPGQEGGAAIADILSGKTNPSGKLATTFPAAYNDDPTAKNFPGIEFPEKATTGLMGMKAVPAEVVYEEGIYVGYRYYNTFHKKPAYEFGYGLSYTSFGYSPVKLSSTTFNKKIRATVTVTNTGKVAGKEVVQLYLGAPAVKLDKPGAELKGFAKTGLLQPGKSETITFLLDAADLASFDTNASAWVAEAGNYTVSIGASSLDIKTTATFNLANELTVAKVHKALGPQVPINELKNK